VFNVVLDQNVHCRPIAVAHKPKVAQRLGVHCKLAAAVKPICRSDLLALHIKDAHPPTAAVFDAAAALSSAPDAAAGAGQQFDLNARTISAVVIAFLVASLAASAGVGGGAFFVPLYMLALGFGECCAQVTACWPGVLIL
jgi:hypothetical protein